MLSTTDRIKELFATFCTDSISAIDKLPQAGSERSYYRIHTASKNYISTYGANIKENESFLYFSEHFGKKKLATPKIFAVNKENP